MGRRTDRLKTSKPSRSTGRSGTSSNRKYNKRKKKKGGKLKYVLLLCVAVGSIIALVKMNTPEAQAEKVAKASSEINEIVKVAETDVIVTDKGDYIEIAPNFMTAKKGILLVGEENVEDKSYVPLGIKLAKKGYMVTLLGTSDVEKVQSIVESYGEVSRWAVGGHGAGGSLVSEKLGSSDLIKGAFFLASYPMDEVNLKDSNLKVVSIYGSEDTSLNLGAWESKKASLPDKASYVIIEGGTHSGFGNYEGDTGTLTEEQQQVQAVVQIVNLMDELR